MKQYTRDHLWIESADDIHTVGLTAFACEMLNEISYVDFSPPQTRLNPGDSLANLESIKIAWEIQSPLAGFLVEQNLKLEREPELLNDSPEDSGWLCRIQCDRLPDDMMTLAEYDTFKINLK